MYKSPIEAVGESTNESLPTEILSEALRDAHRRINVCEAEIADLARELDKFREEERLLKKLLALRNGEAEKIEGDPDATAGREHLDKLSAKEITLSAVIEVLRETGKPVHISELMRVLRERNIPIPGSGSQANLITHLRRDKRLVRPSRGMYALSESGLADMPVPKRKRRKKRSGRAKPTRIDRHPVRANV